MKTFEEFENAVKAELKSNYGCFKEETEEVKNFLKENTRIIKDDYETAKSNGRLETHFSIEVSSTAWGLDLLY